MSALALPTAIAPARPGAPQGAPGESDATGFKSLLDTHVDTDAKPADVEASDIAPIKDEADVAPAAALVPATAVSVVVPLPVALPAEPAPEVTSAATPEGSIGIAGPDPDLSALATSDGMSSARTDQSPPAVEAAISKDLPQPLASDPAESDTAAAKAAAENRLAAAAAAARATTTAKATDPAPAAAVPAHVPVASKKAPSAAPIPPLRALVERTSRPLETPSDKTVDASTSGIDADDAKATAQGASSASDALTVPDRAAGTVGSMPRPGADAAIASDAPSIDAAPAADGATTVSPTVSHARETSLSGLSHATIEATAQIAAQILRKLEGRSTRFEMSLTPDELGRVDVKLDIDSEGRLAARLAFDNPAAATDLRGRADQLRRELEDAGFHLADDAFEFTERDSGSSRFDRGQDARHGQNRAFAAASRLNAEIDVAQPPRWMALSLSPAGVDLKV